jgi:hypothetical protein
MTASGGTGRAGLWFVPLAGAVYLGNYAIGGLYRAQTRLPVPEWVVGFDLLVLVPLAYLLLKRPPLKQALLATFALVSLGVLVGSFVIPQQDKQAWLVLEDLRWVYLGALVLLQAALIVSVVREIRRHWAEPNIETAIAGAIARRVPEPTIAGLVQADARVWLYALVRDRSRFAYSTPAFTAARHDGNAPTQQGFLVLLALEIPVMHLIVHLFSPIAALVITALSVYGLLFLYAEYRATLLRATTLEADHLHIRYGVLGDLEIPYDRIAAVERVSLRPRRQRPSLRFVGTGTANVRIDLRSGTTLPTLLGRRPVESVFIGLDDPAVFRRELADRVIPTARSAGCSADGEQ